MNISPPLGYRNGQVWIWLCRNGNWEGIEDNEKELGNKNLTLLLLSV